MDTATIQRLLSLLRDPTTSPDERFRVAELLWGCFGDLPPEVMVDVAEALVQVKPWTRAATQARGRATPIT